MKESFYLEARALEAKKVYLFLRTWKAPDFGGIAGTTIKRAILSGSGDYIFRAMLDGNILDPATEEMLSSAITYCENVFDNSELMDVAQGVRERVFANVYDALLGSEMVLSDGTGSRTIYRGHYDSSWELVPSYYRSSPKRADHIAYTVHAGRIAYLRKQYPGVDFSSLNALQQEAVVQHYMSGTQLLDFTKSFEIAAYFATHRDGDRGAPEAGAIYRIAPADVEETLRLATVEAPQLPAAFLRIHRQQGVFIRSEYYRLLREPGLFDRWAFYHTPAGLDFEFPEIGVTTALLLPEDVAEV